MYNMVYSNIQPLNSDPFITSIQPFRDLKAQQYPQFSPKSINDQKYAIKFYIFCKITEGIFCPEKRG